jgi:hypothetical protein
LGQFSGNFSVPSYRGTSFLDPKARCLLHMPLEHHRGTCGDPPAQPSLLGPQHRARRKEVFWQPLLSLGRYAWGQSHCNTCMHAATAAEKWHMLSTAMHAGPRRQHGL